MSQKVGGDTLFQTSHLIPVPILLCKHIKLKWRGCQSLPRPTTGLCKPFTMILLPLSLQSLTSIVVHSSCMLNGSRGALNLLSWSDLQRTTPARLPQTLATLSLPRCNLKNAKLSLVSYFSHPYSRPERRWGAKNAFGGAGKPPLQPLKELAPTDSFAMVGAQKRKIQIKCVFRHNLPYRHPVLTNVVMSPTLALKGCIRRVTKTKITKKKR